MILTSFRFIIHPCYVVAYRPGALSFPARQPSPTFLVLASLLVPFVSVSDINTNIPAPSSSRCYKRQSCIRLRHIVANNYMGFSYSKPLKFPFGVYYLEWSIDKLSQSCVWKFGCYLVKVCYWDHGSILLRILRTLPLNDSGIGWFFARFHEDSVSDIFYATPPGCL